MLYFCPVLRRENTISAIAQMFNVKVVSVLGYDFLRFGIEWLLHIIPLEGVRVSSTFVRIKYQYTLFLIVILCTLKTGNRNSLCFIQNQNCGLDGHVFLVYP
jgi:hypothetical protein